MLIKVLKITSSNLVIPCFIKLPELQMNNTADKV